MASTTATTDTPAPPPLLAGDHPAAPLLRACMGRYTVDRLVNESPERFERELRRLIGSEDGAAEGYTDPGVQRDQSVRFAWGHDHDFGAFALTGAMRDRHLAVLATFMTELGALPTDLTGARVLDIGCWTGGTCLALAALGAEVVGVEEVRRYARTVEYLAHAFGISGVRVLGCSLYDLPDQGLDDSFDYVLYSGVLYHVTDPLLSLRICYNMLREGGRCLLESAAYQSDQPLIRYDGAERFWSGSREDRTRRGWNWFVPSAPAAELMVRDAGFDEVRVVTPRPGRLVGVGTRGPHRDMLRAGLSRPMIR